MKKAFYLFLLLSICNQVSAQETFNKRYHFGYPNALLSSIEITDSSFFAIGIATDTIGQNQLGSLFVKFNLEGEVIFSKLLVIPEYTYYTWSNTLLKSEDGNFMASTLVIDSISTGYALIKYTPNGDTLFIKKYEQPFFPQENFIIQNDLAKYNDKYYLIGQIATPDTPFKPDPYLIITDHEGNKTSEQLYGFEDWSHIAMSLFMTEDGGVIGAYSTNTNFVNGNFVARTYLIGIDTVGVQQWEYLSPSGELFYRAFDVIPATDGGYVVATGKGIEVSTANPNLSTLRWHNYIFKLDADRNFEWGTFIRDSLYHGSNELRKIIAVSDQSGYVAIGKIYEPNFIEVGSDNHGIITKVALNGDSLWTRYHHHVVSPSDDHHLYDIEETPDGGFIMVGQATDYEAQPANPPNQQGWLLKVDEHGCLVPGCHLISSLEDDQHAFQLKLYPNPASDYLNIYFRNTKSTNQAYFKIINQQGILMRQFSSRLSDVTHILDVHAYAPGVYFLQYWEGGILLKTEGFEVLH